jgi:hypothetical protein
VAGIVTGSACLPQPGRAASAAIDRQAPTMHRAMAVVAWVVMIAACLGRRWNSNQASDA